MNTMTEDTLVQQTTAGLRTTQIYTYVSDGWLAGVVATLYFILYTL